MVGKNYVAPTFAVKLYDDSVFCRASMDVLVGADDWEVLNDESFSED